MKKIFYEKNHYILESEKFNPFFETILWMTESEFEQWVYDFRNFVTQVWDEYGTPPRVGYSEDEIIDQFNKIQNFQVHTFVQTDEYTNQRDIIRNTQSKIGGVINQWFPTMAKTKINYNASGDGVSIYDYVANEKYKKNYLTMTKRVFRRDGYYAFSRVVKSNNDKENLFYAETALDWIKTFESNRDKIDHEYDYWISARKADEKYSGYSKDFHKTENQMLSLTVDELKDNWSLINEKCKTTLNFSELDEKQTYFVRVFERNQKIFPDLLRSFKVSLCQTPVNFPALTAKFLYEYYTEDFKDQEQIVVWDPSAGWGGRLIGALGVKDDRNILYIGTDPNTDFNLPDGRLIYDDLATFYNTQTNRAYGFFPHTHEYKIFQAGSEVIQFNSEFQKYKGKLDFIFTSPPYFNREQYSEDEDQSFKKFNNYESWRDGFLYETLKTAVEWLKPNRHLAWNIADLKVGDDKFLPLEQDSIDILTSLGMKHVFTWKMAMAQMPGSNRKDENGNATAKNVCSVNGTILKFEPIFIFYKEQ